MTLPAILSTHSHGHTWAADFLAKRPWAAKLAGWSVILFECTFPLLLLGPGWLVIVARVGFAFHAGCAVLMGLNSFLWSFPAVYPCVLALWMVYRG